MNDSRTNRFGAEGLRTCEELVQSLETLELELDVDVWLSHGGLENVAALKQ